MSNEYKQCPRGHFYQGTSCPYCQASTNEHKKTEILMGGLDSKTQILSDANIGNTTGVFKPAAPNIADDAPKQNIPSGKSFRTVINRTVLGTDDVNSEKRKLVGWLVTYSKDRFGMDFKLYEGRNVIGRNPDCDIAVDDEQISGRHATLLFRAGQYSIADEQSSNGTYVNDVDIELDTQYLSDGDIIKMGDTIFKFRSSL